jgi:hypothetical protein
MSGAGAVETLHHVSPLHRPEGLAGEEQPGMVVEIVEDLNITAIGEVPVGGVSLSHLVG